MTKRALSLLLVICATAVINPALAAPTGQPIGLEAMWSTADKALEEKHYKDAAAWYERASKYSDLMAQPVDRRAQLYKGYGQALLYCDQYDKAIPQLTRSLELFDQLEGSTQAKEGLKAHSYGLLGEAYAAKKNYYEAAEYTLKQAEALRTRYPDQKSNGLLEAKAGGWYFHANRKDKAKQWLTQAQQLLKDDIASGKSFTPDVDKKVLEGVEKMLPDCK